jgi:type II secretory pathway pseudopilin PulG
MQNNMQNKGFILSKRIKKEKPHRFLKGFTVIELLVIIAVIGLLSSIVLVSLGPAQKKARDSRRQADLRQINTAMELCYDDSACAGGSEKYIDSEKGANDITNIDEDSAPCFLCPVPKDPRDVDPQQYTWTNGTDKFYCIYTKSEQEADTWYCASNKGTQKKTAVAPYAPTSQDCCGLNASGCSCCKYSTPAGDCPNANCPVNQFPDCIAASGKVCCQLKCKPADEVICNGHGTLFKPIATACEAVCP